MKIFYQTYSVCEYFRAYDKAYKNFILKIDITEDHCTKFHLFWWKTAATALFERNRAFFFAHAGFFANII